jgi:hypothetical protein
MAPIQGLRILNPDGGSQQEDGEIKDGLLHLQKEKASTCVSWDQGKLFDEKKQNGNLVSGSPCKTIFVEFSL